MLTRQVILFVIQQVINIIIFLVIFFETKRKDIGFYLIMKPSF